MSYRISFDANLLKALEVFVAISETGQVTQAAKLLGVTQSAASQYLKTLEEVFDAQLIDRSSRPMRLTAAGRSVRRHATRVLNEVEDLVTEMRHEGPKPVSVLRVGMLASIATTLTPELVTLANERFGVADLTLHAGQSRDHEALLRTKQADIVITSDPLYDMDGLERRPILTETFLLVLPQDYDGPADSLASLLQHLPLVRFAGTTSVGRRIEQHLRRLKLDAPQIIQADRSSMVTACVARGMGFTVLTPSLLIDGLVERMPLAIRPVPGPGFTRSITLLAREGELGEMPAQIADQARAVLRKQIERHMGEVGVGALNFEVD